MRTLRTPPSRRMAESSTLELGGTHPVMPSTTSRPYDLIFGLASTDLPDVFEATIPKRRGMGRLFGGQVAAMALAAAGSTVDPGRAPHSLHAYFVRMGSPDASVHFSVDRTRDGRGFSTRHVTVSQDDRPILELIASFTETEDADADWQQPTTANLVVPPEPSEAHPRVAHLGTHLEVRLEDPGAASGWRIHPFWFRTRPALGPDPLENAVMLTYVSDIAILANAREPGTDTAMKVAASIDHAIWFHRPPHVDEWMRLGASPIAHIGVRGIVHGEFHDATGQLVATVVQEGLLRPS